jgi:4-amino-4-deoxy-L-arabinose transferase-like glycosyltransferase
MEFVKNRRKLYWLIALFGCAVRLVVGIATGGVRHPQLLEYDWIAQSMIAGRGFVFPHLDVNYYSFAPPLYAWISVPGYWLVGSIVPLMLIQIAAGATLAAIAALIAERLYAGSIAGVASGILVALHPGLIIYSATKAHPLTFDALFFALALLQCLRIAERPTLRRFVVFGLIVGVGTLSRGTVVIFLPIAGLWLLATIPKRIWFNAIRNLIVAGLCAAAIIAPWTIRNSILHHQFVFLLTTDAEDFWRGNNPQATGGSYFDNGTLVLDKLSPQDQSELRQQPNEIAQANWFARKSREFIRAQPLSFVRIFLTKLYHFWWFAPQTGVEYPSRWRNLYMLYYVLALFLAVLGLWRTVRVGPPASHFAMLIVVFVFALSVLQSLYYVEGRHRWGIEAMLLALSGVGFATLVERIHLRRESVAKGG